MKDALRISAALLVLLTGGCGPKPVVWQRTLDIGGDETATALASDGSSYYVSFVATKPGGADHAGWFVTKLDSTGSEVWTQKYKDSPYAVCEDLWADDLGHLFAAGRAKADGKDICLAVRYAAGGTDANTDYMVAVLDAKDGRTVWVKNIDLGPNDLATRIASDANDNLAVVGMHGENATNPDIVIMKLTPNGDTLWTRRYDSGGSDEPGDVAFDGFGNIIATGTARVGDSVRCVIIEYAPNGDLIRKFAYGTVAQATGKGIYVTPASDIYITGGLIEQSGKSEILAFEYKPDAVAVWEKMYSPGSSAAGVDLVVNGDVYVAATVQAKTKDVLICRFRQLAAKETSR
jgi:hypothetical protein